VIIPATQKRRQYSTLVFKNLPSESCKGRGNMNILIAPEIKNKYKEKLFSTIESL
jgi:hypothetical protein